MLTSAATFPARLDPALPPAREFAATAKARDVVAAVDLVKTYRVRDGQRRVLDGISFSVGRGEKIAILGRNGAGKSTLVRLIAGIEQPTRGRVVRTMSMSWPIALSGGFGGSMTGADCIRFLARIHNREFADLRETVEDFAELGKYLRMPLKTYSAGMRARLAFGMSLAIDFDCYLIDEVMSVGDRRFQAKSFEELFVKRCDRAMIIVSHNFDIIKTFCTSALVLKGGRGRVFQDTRLAFDIYASL